MTPDFPTDTHYKVVRGAIARWVPPSAVDDLTHDTLMRVLRNLPGLRDHGALNAYCRTAARSVAARWLQRRTRRGERPLGDIDPHARPEAVPDPRWDALMAALPRLGPKMRATVVCFYLEGKNLKETAAALGCPVGTVKQRLHLARHRLRAICGQTGK